MQSTKPAAVRAPTLACPSFLPSTFAAHAHTPHIAPPYAFRQPDVVVPMEVDRLRVMDLANVDCWNFGEKGHTQRACPKPRNPQCQAQHVRALITDMSKEEWCLLDEAKPTEDDIAPEGFWSGLE